MMMLIAMHVRTQEHIGKPIPSNVLELEKLLITKSRERSPPTMSFDEFRSLAKLCLIENEEDLLVAASLLHNFGSLVYFANEEKVRGRAGTEKAVGEGFLSRRWADQSECKQLKDLVILDPQWLMDIMSAVISTKHSYCRHGGPLFLPSFSWSSLSCH